MTQDENYERNNGKGIMMKMKHLMKGMIDQSHCQCKRTMIWESYQKILILIKIVVSVMT